jgi:hypothetical protein
MTDFTKPIEYIHHPDIEIEFIEDLKDGYISLHECHNREKVLWCPTTAVQNRIEADRINDTRQYVITSCYSGKIMVCPHHEMIEHCNWEEYRFVIPQHFKEVQLFSKKEVDEFTNYIQCNPAVMYDVKVVPNESDLLRDLFLVKLVEQCYIVSLTGIRNTIQSIESKLCP